MLLAPPEAAHSNNAAAPAAPSIARHLLLFLALLLIVASETATGAFAEASWQVDLEFDHSQDCWILAGGPSSYSESSPGATRARRIVEEQIERAVDGQACYHQFFDDLQKALGDNFEPDPGLFPPDEPPDAGPPRVQMKFSFAAREASAVRLILASEAVGLRPGNLQFGDELQSVPRARRRLARAPVPCRGKSRQCWQIVGCLAGRDGRGARRQTVISGRAHQTGGGRVGPAAVPADGRR